MRPSLREQALRGREDAEALLHRPEKLAHLDLADFGAGGPGEAALRRFLHALRVPPSILEPLRRLLDARRAARACVAVERYAYWHGARRRLDGETWRRLTRGTAILMYHAFGAPGEPASRFVVPIRRFQRQLRRLVARGPVLALEELVELRRRHELPPAGAVVITIDDGYLDNLQIASPALRRFGVPATVFAVSGRVGGTADWDGAGELSARPLLAWDDLRALQQGGSTIGAHTRTHPRLPELEPGAVTAEVEGSRVELREQLQAPISCFAYPYGRASAAVVAAVESTGFHCACGIRRGLNYPGTPLFDLRRSPVFGDASPPAFAFAVRFGDPELVGRALRAARSFVRGRR
jgi:peptidoglycan/xylan/chitin deacetylase (PgdA/CDA1 family)